VDSSRTDEPVLDVAQLAALRGRMTPSGPLALRLIDLFSVEGPRQVDSLRLATEQGDTRGYLVASHTLKSNAALVGLARLAALCKQGEDRAVEAMASHKPDTEADDLSVLTEAIAEELELGLAALTEARLQGRFGPDA
jgi:HPt (histidine-containing phosphotransfer) domain-containing protein